MIETYGTKSFTAALGLFVTLLASYAFMQSPLFSLHNVEVVGGDYVVVQKVLDHADIQYGTNILRLDVRRVTKALSDLPVVADVRVSRRLPSSLVVRIAEKAPVAYVAAHRGFWAVDVEGVVLYYQESLTKPLPIVTSSHSDEVYEGMVFQSPQLLASLRFLEFLSPGVANQLSEIHVSNTGIVAFTSDYITVNLGSGQEMREKAGVLESLLAKVSQENLSVSHIDVRHPRAPIVEQKR